MTDPGMLEGGAIFATILVALLSIVYAFVIQPIMYGALVWATGHRLQDRPISVLGTYGYGTGRILSIVGAGILYMLLTLVLLGVPYVLIIMGFVGSVFSGFAGSGEETTTGMMAMLIPLALLFLLAGLVVLLALSAKFFCAPQAIVLEGHNPISGFQRSWNLTRGSFWRVLGFLALFILIVTILSVIIGVVVSMITIPMMFFAGGSAGYLLAQSVNVILSTLLSIVLWPLYGIFPTLLYYDLLVRKEGSDLEQRMQQELPLPGQI
jgi:hypothetical protein